MTLYHVTTGKKMKKYHETGHIIAPVRGFTTLMGAMAWAIKVGRKVIVEINGNPDKMYKLPDHHNEFGDAWWCDFDVKHFKCVFSGDK